MAEVIKKLRKTQFLRKEPKALPLTFIDPGDGGGSLQVIRGEKVKTGAKLEVDELDPNVEGKTIKWVFVEAVDGQHIEKRKGFVSDEMLAPENEDIDQPAGFQPFVAQVERAVFADACYVQAELNKTNPAYLYALAFTQSGDDWDDIHVKTNDPGDALAFGVFQFPKDTWELLLKLPETGGLNAEQIKFPTAQCVIAALLAAKSASLLKGLITDRPLTAVDLYLAHLFADDGSFGSAASAKILQGEKDKKDQLCVDVIKQIYPEALQTAFLKRNKAIFKEDGSAKIEKALKTMSDKLQAGFDEVKKLADEIQQSMPANVNGPVFGSQFTGKVIAITDQDVDALARVSHSEVGGFGKFGDAVLTDALAAVVDTIFNRVVYPTKEFPKTVQGVINQPFQFSAINPIGTWQNLKKAPDKNFGVVQSHVQKRAQGTDSKIKGATHFFNPDTSHPTWGAAVKANSMAKYGTPPDSHVHGFPTGYHPPEGYAIQFGKDVSVFTGDGKSLGQMAIQDKSIGSIVAAALKEWNFWGKSIQGEKIGRKDDEIAFATYVRDTYCKPFGASPPLFDIQKDHYFWSAVCISYIIRQAGLSASEFTFSQRHSTYIREAIKARNDTNKSKAYWGYRITEPEAVLAAGDIVGAGRTEGMTFAEAQALFDKTADYDSHSDIVVAVRAGAAEVIGGNVSDSVTRKTIALDASGKIADKKNLSFVVMKKNS
jgi:spore germination cell wall hydrolase CwlJ-like protein